jgi:hypothetical protein
MARLSTSYVNGEASRKLSLAWQVDRQSLRLSGVTSESSKA